METTIQKFKQLGSSKTYLIEYEKNAFGHGAQGHVHQIMTINKMPYGTWAIKILNESSQDLSHRLNALTKFIGTNRLDTEGLSCLPAILLQSSSNQTLAIPMRRASGPDLENGGGVPSTNTLSKRLAAAFELANCVDRLHQKGVIIGDLAHDNLIIDPKNWALYLIDVDGCGFNHNGHSYSTIANNSPKGELCPPEFAKQPYSQEMDLWALSILLHFLLTDEDPISLFGLARDYARPAELEWPPKLHPYREIHLTTLRSLGTPLYDAVIRSFNAGRTKPNQRLRANQWKQLINEAQTHLYQCNCSPHKPFVALSAIGQILYECPMCNTPVMART